MEIIPCIIPMFNDCTQISGKRYIEIAHFVWVLHNILKHTIFAGFVPGGLGHFVSFDPYQILANAKWSSHGFQVQLVLETIGSLPRGPPWASQGFKQLDCCALFSSQSTIAWRGRVQLSFYRSCHAMLCIAQSCLVPCMLLLCSAEHSRSLPAAPATLLAQ